MAGAAVLSACSGEGRGMPVERILEELRRQSVIIAAAQRRQDELIGQLESIGEESDWITVAMAATITHKSVSTIYRFINDGKFRKTKHFGATIYLSRKELESIDDRYCDQLERAR